MIKFIKDTLPELKKDLFRDGVKYLIIAILGVLGIWVVNKLGLLNQFFKTELKISYYSLILILFITIIISSLVTFIVQNKRYQKLKKDSFKDELTGLFNYKAVKKKLDDSIESAKKEKKSLSIILMDIDNFKKINDSFLMSGGDNVMRQLGAYLLNDSRAKDVICRQHMKGDEFLIIAFGTNKDQARMAAERKRKEITETDFQVNESNLINITVSCGIAELDLSKDTTDLLVEKANKALLIAKSLGKNKAIIYQES